MKIQQSGPTKARALPIEEQIFGTNTGFKLILQVKRNALCESIQISLAGEKGRRERCVDVDGEGVTPALYAEMQAVAALSITPPCEDQPIPFFTRQEVIADSRKRGS